MYSILSSNTVESVCVFYAVVQPFKMTVKFSHVAKYIWSDEVELIQSYYIIFMTCTKPVNLDVTKKSLRFYIFYSEYL